MENFFCSFEGACINCEALIGFIQEYVYRQVGTMDGFFGNIEKLTQGNAFFRKVLFTGAHLQLVVMSLLPGEDIGLETHSHTDQFIRVESGEGKCRIGESEYVLSDGVAVVIPAGMLHNVWNTSRSSPLRLYTLYAPPEHPVGTIHRVKADAVEEPHH